MMMASIFRVTVAGTISFLLYASSSYADDVSPEQVKRWIEAGRALPLAKLRAMNADLFEGRLLDAELEEKGDRLIYELEILGPDARVREFELDARTGEVLEEKLED